MNLNKIKEVAWIERLLQIIKRWNNKQRFIASFCLIVFFLFIVKLILDPGRQANSQTEVNQQEKVELAQVDSVETAEIEEADTARRRKEASPNQQKSQPDTFRLHHKKWPYFTRPIISYSEADFDDLNDVQIVAAKKNGISHPQKDREEALKMVERGELVYIGASPLFYVEKLPHSIPYLVPKAYKLLSRVGINFIDSLRSKNLPLHKLIVTSVLRTEHDIKRLRGFNVNATEQSCHRYATTFDLSTIRFNPLDGSDPDQYRQYHILMKRALGEVLRDLRYEGRCYVKHERKQNCFHVTVR